MYNLENIIVEKYSIFEGFFYELFKTIQYINYNELTKTYSICYLDHTNSLAVKRMVSIECKKNTYQIIYESEITIDNITKIVNFIRTLKRTASTKNILL